MLLRALLIALALPFCAQAEEPLNLVADRWPPYADAQMPGRGLAVHFVSTALTRAGYAIHYAEVPWPRALHGVRNGEYDVLVDSWYSAERETFGQYSEPYLVNRLRFLKRKGSPIVFGRLADRPQISARLFAGTDHTYALRVDRQRLLDDITTWLRDNFPVSGGSNP